MDKCKKCGKIKCMCKGGKAMSSGGAVKKSEGKKTPTKWVPPWAKKTDKKGK
jgi:hypothetical protein